MTRLRRLPTLLFVAATAMAQFGCATPGHLPDRFALGRDAAGARCTANRSWNDPSLGSAFDEAYALSCEGAEASRTIGTVSAVRGRAKGTSDATCGAIAKVVLAEVGAADVRRCYDARLAASVIAVRTTRRGVSYQAVTVPGAVAPMERAIAALMSRRAPSPTAQTRLAAIRLDQLPAGKTAPATESGGGFDPTIPLRDGISLNRQGLFVEASRELNDALSRVGASTPRTVQVELLLEAGLADSNIRFDEAARDHFARAETLLTQGVGDRGPFLERKLSTYRALDALNRRDWTAALRELGSQQSDYPLQDLTVLADLNQMGGRDAASAVMSPSAGELSQIVLDANRNWVISIAQLGQGGEGSVARGEAALKRASLDVTTLLNARIDPSSLVWQVAQIERQGGRVVLRQAEKQTGAARASGTRAALARFDCALDALRGTHPADETACTVPLSVANRSRLMAAAAQATGPVIAETMMERASVRARSDAPAAVVLADFDAGVDALIASGRSGSSPPAGMEAYLDLLTKVAGAGQPEAAERFFKAVQAIGEPAIARQMAQLQSVVTSSGDTAAKLRERQQVQRELAALRYQIEDAAADPARRQALTDERSDKSQRLGQLEDQLSAIGVLRAIDDRPVTVADVQRALRPGEVYVKVSRLRTRTWAAIVGRERSYIYPLGVPGNAVDQIAQRVRASIRDDSGRLPFFDAPAAYALFKLLAGPAEPALLAAKAIVFDPSGALQNLPAGVLVVDQVSVRAYLAQRDSTPNDYSHLAFLAGRAEISNALSPRSFLIGRALPGSSASQPFIGFGENASPQALSGEAAARLISFGTGCPMPYRDLASIMSANTPVSAREVMLAASALGVPAAPEVTGRAFTDTAIMAASDRGDYIRYKVIHFATHGVPEIHSQCTVVPPSLVTTLAPPAARDLPQSDGLLSFSEIAQLRLDANLVVLSACETAAGVSARSGRLGGQDESAATLDGLVRAFITANARAVVATYWKVPAVSASDDFMRTFYANGRTATIGTALSRAQAMLIAQPAYSHPYYWGAYFLVGDGAKTMLTRSNIAPQKIADR